MVSHKTRKHTVSKATLEASEASLKTKRVIEGEATNAFRVVSVGADVVIETFYLYPDFASLAHVESFQFNADPDIDDQPNKRLIMSREVAARLANALVGTLNLGFAPAPDAEASEKAKK
jgi:hypothetical protein